MNSHRAEQMMDPACTRGEAEKDQATLEALERNVMRLVEENISNACGRVLNGKYSGYRFLLNRPNDMGRPNSQVPSQRTICLEELLNPTHGVLRVFIATFTSDILSYPVFPDSCYFAPEIRQGIGCHHPKIFLFPRENSIRATVTSANLTCAQVRVMWENFQARY